MSDANDRMSEGDWYCKECGYLSPQRVTFSETCDTCHKPVEFHTVGDQDTITQLRTSLADKEALLAEAVETIEMERDFLREEITNGVCTGLSHQQRQGLLNIMLRRLTTATERREQGEGERGGES